MPNSDVQDHCPLVSMVTVRHPLPQHTHKQIDHVLMRASDPEILSLSLSPHPALINMIPLSGIHSPLK